MKLLFIGTVEFSRRCLQALLAAGHMPLVVTMPECEGRQRHSDWAGLGGTGFQVIRAVDVDGEMAGFLRGRNIDLALVCGWSRLLPLDLAPHMVGSHASLLPKGRGRHPIPHSILYGHAGLTLFRLTAEPDAGPILWQEPITVTYDHAAEVYEKVCRAGERGVVAAVKMVETGIEGTPQDETEATWWSRRGDADNRIDWSRPSWEIERLVRAISRPYPGAWSPMNPLVPARFWRLAGWDSSGRIAPPGTVQEAGDRFVVATGDGWVAFSEWELPGPGKLRPGMRLA